MRRIIFLALIWSCYSAQAQKDNIHFNRIYCDSVYFVNDMLQTDDGGFIGVGNYSTSMTMIDGLIIKLDANYDTVWKKIYGGSQNDYFSGIAKINDNRYLLSGLTESFDGDLAAYGWPILSPYNVWIMIIDSNGNFIRGSCYGDEGQSVEPNVSVRPDGNIFISGTTFSQSGDFAGNPGGILVDQTYIAYTDTLLTKKWIKWLTGLPSDDISNACNTLNKNGNLIVPVYTSSISGDFSGLGPIAGNEDVYVFCIDTNQNIIWKKRYGGSSFEWVIDIDIDSLNNLYLFVLTDSKDGDLKGNEVTWMNSPVFTTLLKTDSIGNILWKHSYGSLEDTTILEIRNIEPTSFIIDNDKIWLISRIQGRDSIGDTGFGWTTQLGSADIWLVQCDSLGILQNRKRLGGLKGDVPQCILMNNTKHRPLIIYDTGEEPTTNLDCRIKKNNDCKIFEVEQWPTEVSQIHQSLNIVWTISPNPNDGNFIASFVKPFTGNLKIFTSEGKLIETGTFNNTSQKKLNISHYPSGIYYFEISNKNGRQVKQLTVKH